MEELVSEAVTKLEINNGPVYFQIKIENGHPYLIEVTPRLDGCHMWRLIKEYTGVNLLDITMTHFLDGTVPDISYKVSDIPMHTEFFCEAPDTEFDISKYDGWVDWGYIMDCEKEAASEEFEPYWENNTEPEYTDTDACIIVGEVHNTVYNGLTIEDHHTITEKHFYIDIDNNYYIENLKEYINKTDTLCGWDDWFCKIIETTGDDCGTGDSFYTHKIFDLSDEGEYFILDTVYCETFNDREHGFCITLKIEKNELTEYLTEFVGEDIEMNEEILDAWDREIKLELVNYSLI